MQSMPYPAEMVVAIVIRERGQLHGAQSHGRLGIQIDTMQSAVCGEQKQTALSGFNGADIQDSSRISPSEGPRRVHRPARGIHC